MRTPIAFAVLLSLSTFGCPRRHPPAPAAGQPQAHTAATRGDGESGGNGGGHRRRREAALYVDGKPLDVLAPGELPATLTASAPGRYRLLDLLRSYGVPLDQVEELQLSGQRHSEAFIVSGAELRSPAGRQLLLQLAPSGEPDVVAPPGLGRGVVPAALIAVAVYVAAKPPTLSAGQGLTLDGKPVGGVAYYGEALRGGVRIYVDDKLVLPIKKRLLEELEPSGTVDGLPAYALWPLLGSRALDLGSVVDGAIVTGDQRGRVLTRAQLEQASLIMGEQHQNDLVVGGEKLATQALMLRTHASH